MSVYNKKETDLSNTDDYNVYLEEIEEFVYKLLHKIDLEETEEKLKEYSIANKQNIELNNSKRDQEYEKFIKLQNLEKRFKSERNRINREIIKEEQKIKSLSKMEIVNRLQSAKEDVDPDKIIADTKASMFKRMHKFKGQLEELEKKYLSQKQSMIRNQNSNEIGDTVRSDPPMTPFNGDRMLTLPFTFEGPNY